MSNTELKSLLLPKSSNNGFWRFSGEESEITWDIKKEKLNSIARKGIHSPIFPNDSNAEFKWKIVLFLHSATREAKNLSAFYLMSDFEIKFPLIATFHFSIKKGLQWEVVTGVVRYAAGGQHDFIYYKFKEISELQSHKIDGYLSMRMKVAAHYEDSAYVRSNFVSEQNLFHNYSSILNDGSFSDLILCAKEDGTEFKVHRTILSARSKVFAAMLSLDMKESQTGRIEIKDVPSATVKKLLDFIYSCQVKFESIPEMINLIGVAEKYDLMDLKLQCAKCLTTVINAENICSILEAAKVFNVPNLKDDVLKYMCRNEEQFTDPKIFKELSSEIVAEIAANFAKKCSVHSKLLLSL